MKIRKDLVFVILATFCLTATVFIVIPTKSAWDPWADLKEDGTVDIYDAIILSGAFGTSGDTTKNVNVTNPAAKTIQRDLNISISYQGSPDQGSGDGFTDFFPTEGYDRMFVSVAIVDTSNVSGSVSVYLNGVHWLLEVINGTQITSYTHVDYDAPLHVSASNGSYLPTSSSNSTDFAVEGSEGSLSLHAEAGFTSGWVLIRTWIYLAHGTTSPPTVQDTRIANWPYYQAKPAFDTRWYYCNNSIYNGFYYVLVPIDVGGYSRMSISIVIEDCSYHDVPATTTVSLNSVNWGGWSYEYPRSALNATYYGTSLPIYSQQIPSQFETKYSSCDLMFRVSSNANPGWIEWRPIVYLRNE